MQEGLSEGVREDIRFDYATKKAEKPELLKWEFIKEKSNILELVFSCPIAW